MPESTFAQNVVIAFIFWLLIAALALNYMMGQ